MVLVDDTQRSADPRQAACAHCGLPVPRGLFREGEDNQYCCGACETAYAVIHGCGLERFYDYAARTRKERERARGSGRRYDEFDDPVFFDLYAKTLVGGLVSAEVLIEGMHCAACVWLLERLPSVHKGVHEVRVNYARSRLEIVWDAAVTSLSSIARQIDSFGYQLHTPRRRKAAEIRRDENRRMLIRVGIAGALAGNAMLAAIALYAGAFTGIEPAYESLFRWVGMSLATLAVVWPGAPFFRGAMSSLRTRVPHTDLPVALGLGVGLGAGLLHTITGEGEIYFDTLTMLVFLLLVGRWLQAAQQRWASDSVELLGGLTPSTAWRVTEAGVREVPIESVHAEDLVDVPVGGTVPADGCVEEGVSAVDRSLLTGESRPVEIMPGSDVEAGVVNLGSPLRVRVRTTGAATRIGRILELVESATHRKAPIVRLADRIAGGFVFAVTLLAVATFFGWRLVDPSRAVESATALLIVTCPCALALATPLAVSVAIGRASRRGMFIKGGDTLEAIARARTLVLDKTGTVTTGRCALASWTGPEHLLEDVARIEAQCEHPIARAFAERAGAVADGSSVEIMATPSGGVEAVVGGSRYAIGSVRFVLDEGGAVAEPAQRAEIESLIERGLSPVLVAVDGRVAGIAGVGDRVREEVPGVIASLRREGRRVVMLSGDEVRTVRATGEAIGLDPEDAIGGCLPEEKVRIVEELMREGPVVMVGDGVNDAAALARASVGVAVRGGAEASLSAADVFLSEEGLAPLERLIEGSRRTFGVIRVCLGVSLAYNVVCATLAVLGVIGPLIAAVLMPLSSVTVLLLSRYMRSFSR